MHFELNPERYLEILAELSGDDGVTTTADAIPLLKSPAIHHNSQKGRYNHRQELLDIVITAKENKIISKDIANNVSQRIQHAKCDDYTPAKLKTELGLVRHPVDELLLTSPTPQLIRNNLFLTTQTVDLPQPYDSLFVDLSVYKNRAGDSFGFEMQAHVTSRLKPVLKPMPTIDEIVTRLKQNEDSYFQRVEGDEKILFFQIPHEEGENAYALNREDRMLHLYAGLNGAKKTYLSSDRDFDRKVDAYMQTLDLILNPTTEPAPNEPTIFLNLYDANQ